MSIKIIDGFDHKWGEQDDDVLDVESATHRLALCNMDWDSIKAKDLLVLLNSFKPPDGVINSITVGYLFSPPCNIEIKVSFPPFNTISKYLNVVFLISM